MMKCLVVGFQPKIFGLFFFGQGLKFGDDEDMDVSKNRGNTPKMDGL